MKQSEIPIAVLLVFLVLVCVGTILSSQHSTPPPTTPSTEQVAGVPTPEPGGPKVSATEPQALTSEAPPPAEPTAQPTASEPPASPLAQTSPLPERPVPTRKVDASPSPVRPKAAASHAPVAVSEPVKPAPPAAEASPDVAVEYNFPAPTSAGVGPVPTTGQPVPGLVSLRGTIVRPNERQEVRPLSNHEVFVLGLTGGIFEHTTTDSDGHYSFHNLEPRYDYYIVVISPLAATSEVEYNYIQLPGQAPGTLTYYPYTQQVQTHHDMSWHQLLELSKPGLYELNLDASNADPRYCSDVQPTHDNIEHSAYRFSRVGNPSFIGN